jgi:hypothetical protein
MRRPIINNAVDFSVSNWSEQRRSEKREADPVG